MKDLVTEDQPIKINKGLAFIRKKVKEIKEEIRYDKNHVRDEPKKKSEQSVSGKWAFKRIEDNTELVRQLNQIIEIVNNNLK